MKSLRWTALLLPCASLALSSCAGQITKAAAPVPTLSPTPVASESPTLVADSFEAGLAKASDASYAVKTAETREDWDLAANRWQIAIELMQSVTKQSKNYAQAQKNLVGYQRSLVDAQNRKKHTTSAAPLLTTASAKTAADGSIGSTSNVKSSAVSVNDFFEQYMDAVVNRGSSGGEYWCTEYQALESSFFAPRSWRLLSSDATPNGDGGSFTIQLDSSNKGGAQITANWKVIVAKEKSKAQAKARNLPGGWCVAAILEK